MTSDIIRVLYVDDDAELLDIGRLFIEQSPDFVVTTVLSAPKALTMLETETFDAIISDYQMPEMDGIEFLTLIRTRYGQIPFILFTGRGREEIVIKALNAGADFYVQKGGEPESQFADLTNKIRQAVRRRKAEQALQDNEIRYRALFRNSSDILHILDARNVILFDSPSSTTILGYPEGSLVGKNALEYIHPDDRERVTEGIRQVHSGKNTGAPVEFRTRNASGAYIWVESIAVNLFGEPGVDGIVVTTRQIDERKRAELALEKKTQELLSANEKLAASEEELRQNVDDLGRSERALKESEERVRHKLESLLMPAGDIGTLELGDIIDRETLWQLLETFSTLTGISTAILDTKGSILVATNWREICTQFHRVNPETAAFCTESDLHLSEHTKPGESTAYKCRNHLWDVLTPLYIGDKHMGNIFIGQFFYDDETVEESIFLQQAERYGFDREKYLAAFHRVPRYRREKIQELMNYLVKFTGFVSRLSYANLKLARTIAERDALLESLKESETRFRQLVGAAVEGIVIHDDGIIRDANERACELFGYSHEEMIGRNVTSLASPGFVDFIRHKVAAGSDETYEAQGIRRDGSLLWAEIHTHMIGRGSDRLRITTLWDITGRKRTEKALMQVNRKLTLLSGITRHDIGNQLSSLTGYLAILEKKQSDPELQQYFRGATTAAGRISAMIRFTKEYEMIGHQAPVWQDCRKLVDAAIRLVPAGQVTVKNDLLPGFEVFADPLIATVFYNLMDNAARHGGKITTVRVSAMVSGNECRILCEDDGDGVPAPEKTQIFVQGFGKNTGMGLFLAREILDITGITIRENGEAGKGARFELGVPDGAYRFMNG